MRSVVKGMLVTSGGFQVPVDSMLLPSQEDEPVIWDYIPPSPQMVWVVKNLTATVGNARDVSSVPGLERSPGVGNNNPLQYSFREHPMDTEAWLSMGTQSMGSQRVRHNWAHTQHNGSDTCHHAQVCLNKWDKILIISWLSCFMISQHTHLNE